MANCAVPSDALPIVTAAMHVSLNVAVLFRSVKDLINKIDEFVTSYNESCQPFSWTATADSILAKLARLCGRINGTEH